MVDDGPVDMLKSLDRKCTYELLALHELPQEERVNVLLMGQIHTVVHAR